MEELPDSLPKNSDDLIGDLNDKFVGNKLPSNREVLSVLLYRRLALVDRKNVKINKSADMLSKELNDFWKKTTILYRP